MTLDYIQKKISTKFRVQGGLKLVKSLLNQGWTFEDLNENFVTLSFEIEDSKNKTLVECFCKESSDNNTRCFHEGPCKPKDSTLVGMHCMVCAGWHGEHKKGCHENR